jgi:hypothetical protein
MKITKQLFFALVIFLALPRMTEAAVLYFSPSGGEEKVGDVFTVDAKIDLESGEECVNVIEGVIGFDSNFLEAVDFSVGDSMLSLWINLPKNTDMPEVNRLARLSFSGGTPGGYCGKIPGDPGASNIIGKLIFKVKNYQPEIAAASKARVFFLDTTRVLQNDGIGSAAKVTRQEASYFIAKSDAAPKQEWDTLLTADKTPPEPFILEIQQNSDLYNGRYYLIFSTIDKQTGLDHYSIQETKRSVSEQRFWGKLFSVMVNDGVSEAEWLPVESPYVLLDQRLKSDIRVKAVDKAGNERIAEYIPKEEGRTSLNILKFWPLVLLLIVIVSAISLYSYRRTKVKRQAP